MAFRNNWFVTDEDARYDTLVTNKNLTPLCSVLRCAKFNFTILVQKLADSAAQA
jgi:hypothetical protein